MSGNKKNQGEDGTVVTPHVNGDAALLALAEEQISILTKALEDVSADRDNLVKDMNTVGNELNSANELIITQDAQIDHLKEVVESLKGSEEKAKTLISESVATALNPLSNDPAADLRATLEQHPEHKVIYVKGEKFSFRKPKDIENWIEKSREEILSL